MLQIYKDFLKYTIGLPFYIIWLLTKEGYKLLKKSIQSNGMKTDTESVESLEQDDGIEMIDDKNEEVEQSDYGDFESEVKQKDEQFE